MGQFTDRPSTSRSNPRIRNGLFVPPEESRSTIDKSITKSYTVGILLSILLYLGKPVPIIITIPLPVVHIR